MSIEEILDDFPDLTKADIQACFSFTADRDRRLTVIPYEVFIAELASRLRTIH
jgi:hypothetical protein